MHTTIADDILLHSCNSNNNDDETYSTVARLSTKRQDTLTPEALSKLWRIGLKAAKMTILATTHQCLRTTGLLSRRFRTDRAHMRYKRLVTKQGLFYVDALLSKVTSIRGYTCGNLYTNNLGFRKFFPMESQNESAATLQTFIEMVGIPHRLHSDNAKIYVHGDFNKKAKKYGIRQSFTEPHSPWQNRAESGIREVKKYARKIMEIVQAPLRLWCFAFEYSATILSLTASGLYQLGNRTPYEHVLHYTPDISEYTTFKWYQWSYYWDQIDKEKKLCRWLGAAHEIGQSMCYWVLLPTGQYIARSTVIPIPDEDLLSESLKQLTTTFTSRLHDVIGNHNDAVVDKKIKIDENYMYLDIFYDNPQEEELLIHGTPNWRICPFKIKMTRPSRILTST